MPDTGLGMRDMKMNKTLSLTSRSTVRKGKNPAQQRNQNHSIVFAATQADPAHSVHPGGRLPVEIQAT